LSYSRRTIRGSRCGGVSVGDISGTPSGTAPHPENLKSGDKTAADRMCMNKYRSGFLVLSLSALLTGTWAAAQPAEEKPATPSAQEKPAAPSIGEKPSAPPTEQKSLTELRNTVVNLLQTLVERGVMTKEQAEALVKQAQDKAAAEAAQAAEAEAAEAGAVRVP